MISLTPSRARRIARDEAPRATGERASRASSPGSRRCAGVPAGRIGNRTTALAPQAPRRNWPSAPMFHSRIRKASEQARPVRMSGVALTSVSDQAPTLPNATSAMWSEGPDRVAADEPQHDPADEQGHADGGQGHDGREPARRIDPGFEAKGHPPPTMSRPIFWMSAVAVSNDPATQPSYMTSTRSARARISSRSSLISRIAVPSARRWRRIRWTRLDGPDVEAAGRLGGDHHRRAGIDLARQDRGAGGCRRTGGVPACRWTATRSRTTPAGPSAIVRDAPSRP